MKTIFRNKQWHVYWEPWHGDSDHLRIIVESQTKAFVDYPILYQDGRVAYDFPERVPEYIKKVVARELMKTEWAALLRRKGMLKKGGKSR